MKKYLCSAMLLVLFVLIFSFSFNNTARIAESRSFSDTPVVLIDAGHGGVDGGAVAADGTVEKDINLSIATKLNELLKLVGFNTIMTRTEDISIHDESAVTIRQKKVSDIKNRLSLLDDGDAICMISIHQNIYSSAKYSGTQVFYGKNNENSKFLAQCIQQSVRSQLQADNERDVKQTTSDIYLLYHASKPCVMVECGFMSNSAELENLKNSEYQNKIAFSILCGFIEYYSKY